MGIHYNEGTDLLDYLHNPESSMLKTDMWSVLHYLDWEFKSTKEGQRYGKTGT